MNKCVALIGLGAIGTPIADKLYAYYGDNFYLVASGKRRRKLEGNKLFVNGIEFTPKIISNKSELENNVSILIVCIKNYDIYSSIDDIRNVINDETIILPLQNGIESYDFFCREFPNNIVLQGYVQGPNTIINDSEYYYKNPGELHMGNPNKDTYVAAKDAYELLAKANLDVHFEDKIKKMVWKKWMLNVAGNSVTALTGADYSKFKTYPILQQICRDCMSEFLKVAAKEKIELNESDINDVIEYYISYSGNKKTSMLVDVLKKRRTENEFLAGSLLKKAKIYGLNLPITNTLYSLLSIKEAIYMANQT
jgi:2-dehydropantoate 2-reductase